VSKQVDRVMAQYGVTTEKALIRAVRDEYTRETGERFTLRDAELMLDGMYEAEYQRIAGGAYVCDYHSDSMGWDACADRPCAETDDRPAIERYGTPEHEAWLIEMEAGE
jgi:hypothetical protein